jgi:hypothetical protein
VRNFVNDHSDIEVGVDKLPRATFKQLSDFVDGKIVDASFLKDVGGRVGAFAVTNLGSAYAEAVESFQKSAPECLENFDTKLPVFDMADGSKRRTYATQVRIST